MALKDVITIPPEERNRKTGTRNAGAVPWGTHLCYFYDTKQDLIDFLVPYFKVGLENNEFCIWVTSEYLDEKEAEEAIRKAVPDFAQYLERGQIEIIPHTEWYLKDGVFNGQRVINAWIGKLERALAKGYGGMRVTGDTDWVGKRYWRKFADYEKQVHNIIGENRMIALYTYSLGRCGASGVIDVVSNHQFALTRQAGGWVLIKNSEHKRLQHDLNERKKELKCLYRVTNIAEKPGITLDELYQEVVNLLPQGWQYPEITCARITTDGDEFKTENYVETEWKQSADIMAHGAKVGAVEVNYLEARTEIDEGTFLKEERRLIDAVAERLGDIAERKRAEGSQETALPVQSRGWRRLTPLQERFVRSGFEGYKDQEIIELLLSLVLSPRESKRLAKKCIDEFQNLRGFLSASSQELQRAGISLPCVFCIKLLRELPTEVLKQKILEKPVYKSPQEILGYLSYMRDLKKEVFKVIYLNNRNQIIDTIDLFEGTLDSIPIRPREIVDSAIKHNASALIFVHNHPTGDPTPSKTDKQLTRDLVFVGMILQIKVLDHIIIGENKYSSFAESGLIQKYEDDFLTMKIRRMPDTGVHSLRNLLPVFISHIPMFAQIEETGVLFL